MTLFWNVMRSGFCWDNGPMQSVHGAKGAGAPGTER
jgi:hypothetical protein